MRGAGPVDAATCVALHAEVVTYTGGAERRLGVFPLSTVDRRA
jgi:hypothetical protein